MRSNRIRHVSSPHGKLLWGEIWIKTGEIAVYLKKGLITALRIKNILLLLFCGFEFAASTTYIISLFSIYSDKPEYAWGAVDMKFAIVMTCVAVVLLIVALMSIKHVGNAVFYSSFLEGDLDGFTTYADLSQVMGKSQAAVHRQLHIYRVLYMKNFRFIQSNGGEMIELYSKKCLCECRSCGAHIEKRVFFTGTCPYCHSSDLHAKVLSNDHFYSVSNQLGSGNGRPDFYKSSTTGLRKGLYFVLSIIGLSLGVIILIYALSQVSNYFDEEYQKKMLLDPSNHLFSYKLIKDHIRDGIIYGGAFALVLLPLGLLRFKKTMALFSAANWANYFSRSTKPFINANTLPDLGFASSGKSKLKRIRYAIKNGYLKNCTLEVHDGQLVVALAKMVVKDRCLSCGAPLTGVTDENSRCSYCGNLIMGVLQKR